MVKRSGRIGEEIVREGVAVNKSGGKIGTLTVLDALCGPFLSRRGQTQQLGVKISSFRCAGYTQINGPFFRPAVKGPLSNGSGGDQCAEPVPIGARFIVQQGSAFLCMPQLLVEPHKTPQRVFGHILEEQIVSVEAALCGVGNKTHIFRVNSGLVRCHNEEEPASRGLDYPLKRLKLQKKPAHICRFLAGLFSVIVDGLATVKPSAPTDVDTGCVRGSKKVIVQPALGHCERTSQREVAVEILIQRSIIVQAEKGVPIWPGRGSLFALCIGA